MSDAPGARDEYHSYLPQVFRLLVGGAGQNQIAAYLESVETDNMELPPNRDRAEKAAFVLIGWRGWLDDLYGTEDE